MATATTKTDKLANYPPDWPLISHRCKERYDFTCQSCLKTQYAFSTLVLNSHHIDFNPWNNDDDNLVCLCGQCHPRLHAILVGILNRFKRQQQLLAAGQHLLPIFENFELDLSKLTWRIIKQEIYRPTTE